MADQVENTVVQVNQPTTPVMEPGPEKQGCGCGQAQNAAALAERIKGRLDRVYKTRSKVF